MSELINNVLKGAIEIDNVLPYKYNYSVCTLVSNLEEYTEMVISFQNAGFDRYSCEFLYIDNSKGNKFDAYAGINKFLAVAQGKYIILCHQDILLNFDNRAILETRIEQITQLDSNWAIIGNAGAVGIKHIVIRITEPMMGLQKYGNPPKKVISVDENFMLIKKECNLGVSNDLAGFHLYGADLCLQASNRGYSAYVVNFNLLHKSKGNADHRFFELKNKMRAKYFKAWRGRYMQTTITKFYISGSRLENYFYNSSVMMFISRQYFKWIYRKENKTID